MSPDVNAIDAAQIEQAHAFLDGYTKQQGFFKEALGRVAQGLSATPLFVLAVWPRYGQNEVRVSFSLDDALNALYPRPEVRAVAEDCLAALREAMPVFGDCKLTYDFHRGGEPPP